LTNTSGAAERYPVFLLTENQSRISPTKRRILASRAFTRNDSVKKISIEKQPSFYRELAWSPDSKKLVFSDRRLISGWLTLKKRYDKGRHFGLFGAGKLVGEFFSGFQISNLCQASEKPSSDGFRA
jgi:hypothetical protein